MSVSERILVTGARGFLGSHIVAKAREYGADVVGGYREAKGAGTVVLDICDHQVVESAFRATEPTCVVHCAAYGLNYCDQDPARALSVNVSGSLTLIDAAARHKVGRFVHVGTAFEYGKAIGPISEDSPLNPTAVYGATKAAATILVRERAQALHLPLTIVRPFSIWGPADAPYHLIPQVISACIRRAPLALTACETVRDYMYVEDVAGSILALTSAQNVPAGAIFNIGTGKGMILRDFVLSVARFLGGEELMRFGELPYRSTEMPSLVADIRRMVSILGIRPETPMSEAVRRTASNQIDQPPSTA
jgi:nucleoside-diphosphate-sugar epimerase